ncbi:MAG: DUF4468 domain-containing protein [Phocaeicola sp.]
MKKILLLLLICLPILAQAQTNDPYLAGAIQLEENRVTFNKEIEAAGLSKQQLYDTLLEWANKRYQPEGKMNARVLFTNVDEGSIAIAGEEWIVFASTSLALDRSRIYYGLQITCQTGKVELKMNRIRYWYDEARDGGQKYAAEEWITDEIALNKSKTKLVPICGKFRRKTIDLKEELFAAVQAEIGNKLLGMGAYSTATYVKGAEAAQGTNTTPLVKLTPAISNVPTQTNERTLEEKINQAARITLTASDEQFELEKAYWGGMDQLFGKQVASFLIDQSKKMGNMLLEQSNSYIIRFYEAGMEQPSIVIECKKLMTQPISGQEAKAINSLRDDKKSYNMYIGEVTQITE